METSKSFLPVYHLLTERPFGYLMQQNWCIFNYNSISSHTLADQWSQDETPGTAKLWQSSYLDLNFGPKQNRDIQLYCISHPD